jgi:hypothetical protein
VVEGHTPRRDEETQFLFNVVGTEHFDTLRIPLLAGRDFDDRDDPSSAPVAIVNETLARRYWGSTDAALGRRLRTTWASGPPEWKTVIGVARDIKYARLNEGPRPFVYLPHSQAFNPQMFVHARGAGSVAALTDVVHRHIRTLDGNLPIMDSAPLADLTTLGVGVYDITARTLGIIGVAALALSALGIYGLVAYSVKQSTHEIGVRLAIGAQRNQIASRYLAGGMRLGILGAGIGLVAALAVTRLIASLLYGVSATDAASFSLAAAGVLSVAAAASLVPAWHAARVDPLVALRHH